MAGFINYDSPDYQRLIQQSNAKTFQRGVPAARNRVIQSAYVGDVMKRRGELQNIQLANQKAMDALGYKGRSLGLTSRGLQDRLLGQRRLAALDMQRIDRQRSDMRRGLLWGLGPTIFSAVEGKRRRELSAQDVARQEKHYRNVEDILRQQQGGQ